MDCVIHIKGNRKHLFHEKRIHLTRHRNIWCKNTRSFILIFFFFKRPDNFQSTQHFQRKNSRINHVDSDVRPLWDIFTLCLTSCNVCIYFFWFSTVSHQKQIYFNTNHFVSICLFLVWNGIFRRFQRNRFIFNNNKNTRNAHQNVRS